MKRAHPAERVALTIMGDANVASLGMQQTVDRLSTSRPAPQRCSPSAAAFTSVSSTTGTSRPARSDAPSAAPAHAGLGVEA
jgi:hypothetical protein